MVAERPHKPHGVKCCDAHSMSELGHLHPYRRIADDGRCAFRSGLSLCKRRSANKSSEMLEWQISEMTSPIRG